VTTTTRSGKKAGRRSYAQLDEETVFLAQKYYGNGQHTLRDVAYALAKEGFLTRSGKPFGPAAIRKMIQTPLSVQQRESLPPSRQVRHPYRWDADYYIATFKKPNK
jgi:hypothetical protein